MAARQLEPGRARARRARGEPDLGEHLGRGEGRGQLGQEELAGRERPLARRPAGGEAGVQAQRHRGQLGRRVGVAQAAADGPAVADLEMPDPRERIGQERHVPGGERAPLHGALSGHRPDGEAAVPDPDVRQLPDAVEVDQPLGRGEPHVQDREEALAAGEELRRVAMLAELGDGLVDRPDGRVLEDRGLHSRGHSGRGRAPTPESPRPRGPGPRGAGSPARDRRTAAAPEPRGAGSAARRSRAASWTRLAVGAVDQDHAVRLPGGPPPRPCPGRRRGPLARARARADRPSRRRPSSRRARGSRPGSARRRPDPGARARRGRPGPP